MSSLEAAKRAAASLLAPAGPQHHQGMKPHFEENLAQHVKNVGKEAAPMYYKRHALDTLPAALPEEPTPSDIVYQHVHDLRMLDSNPRLNLASYVTTWMEKEAQQLMMESMPINHADGAIYPSSTAIEDKCVQILADLFHAESPFGCATIGSTEAALLGGLNMKKRWAEARKAKGLPTDKPNFIVCYSYQVCWSKFARYWDVEMRLGHLKPGSYVLRAEDVEAMADENTIGIVAILGSTYTGHFDDVKALDALCDKLRREKGLDLMIHVDAASGGFIAPFLYPDLDWDFKLKNVISICASGHKYGYVFPGVGWQMWRSEKVVHPDMIFHLTYLGSDQKNLTLNFSRPASQIVASYYQFLRLGRQGFTLVATSLQQVACHLADGIVRLGMKVVNDPRETVPLVAFHLLPYEPGQEPFADEDGDAAGAGLQPGETEGELAGVEEGSESVEEGAGEQASAAPGGDGCRALGKQGAGGVSGGVGKKLASGASRTTSRSMSAKIPEEDRLEEGSLKRPYTEFEFVEQLKQHGWSVPAYKLAPDCSDQLICRIVVREDFSIVLADELLKTMKQSLEWLDAHFAGRSRAERDMIAERTIQHAPNKAPSVLSKKHKMHVVC